MVKCSLAKCTQPHTKPALTKAALESKWVQIPTQLKVNNMDIEEAISGLEERLRQAQLNSDINELSILIDDKLTFVAPDGSIISKDDDLNLHQSGNFKITKMELIERHIQAFENTVVVNTLMDESAIFDGHVQNDKIRFIRVWHQFTDRWRIISGCMHMLAL